MLKIFSTLFDSNEKQLAKRKKTVEEINLLEDKVSKYSDKELLDTTEKFKKDLDIDVSKARLSRDPFKTQSTKFEIEARKKSDRDKLSAITPEVFARVREAAKRTVAHRAFDAQVLGATFLAEGFVTELFTGEGKTLVATMPLFLYALMGKGAHLVTVNDYLARRDGEWCGHIFNVLGMSVGIITPGASYKFISDEELIKLKGNEGKKKIKERDELIKKEGRLLMSSMEGTNIVQCTKKEAYECDVIYGTNNEFGFDYLRDNMAVSLDQRVQSPLYYAIVDECDSILIDEARTPLIISSPAEDSNEEYRRFADVVGILNIESDYVVDEKAGSVSLTDEGVNKVEKRLGVENLWENHSFAYHLENALKAKELYRKDDQYIIKDGEVLIVDEFTGRVLPGRRYSEGLHQAIEAKEGVPVKRESRTHATITFQNYFRLYDFLAGMTGTAITEAEEFADIYNLEVIVVPTNLPVVRKDSADKVYRTQQGKYTAVIEEIKEMYEKGRPVLVGTTSVEISEYLSSLLKKEGISHNVLNAKQHEKEAKIVAQAGLKGQVTIATNMAGRGTDIALGEGVVDLDGLHIIGTERHESRRVDNQLRGRSGRQGDPGSSRFFVSFEDDLMRIFGGDAMGAVMARVGMEDDMPIESGMIGRTIESAQKRVESHNFDIRKHLVEYDDVLNQQREIVYDLRRKIISILNDVDDKEVEAKIGKVTYKFDKSFSSSKIIETVRDFSIKDPSSWNIDQWAKYPELTNPLSLWILKLSLDSLDFLVSVQLSDDKKLDNKEEFKVLVAFNNIVPTDLAEESAKKLGYKGWKDFSEKFDKANEPSVQKKMLSEVLLVAHIVHVQTLGLKLSVQLERQLILQTLDRLWMDHLDIMTDLRHGIGLRGYAQKNPLVEYKNEGFNMFDNLLSQFEDSIVKRFYKVKVLKKQSEVEKIAQKERVILRGDSRPGKVEKPQTVIKSSKKPGRNDPCPCGSGKKYKKCHYPQYG
ncbi:MAG: preprotein translocase subunit SecA [bacterium]